MPEVMSKIVIGIHGLSNKPPAVELYDQGWKQAMLEGLAHNARIENKPLNFEGVYWADRNYDHEDTNSDSYRPARSGAIKSYEEGILEDIAQAVERAGGKLIDWFKEKLDINKVADRILEEKLSDLHRYYEEPGKYQELTSLLASALEKHADKRIMLVGHSMGSIIAYDTLRILGERNTTLSIDHFITLGSPLGLPHVVLKMAELHGQVRTPSNVKRWTNFADRRDPVAFDQHLRDDYKANVSNIRVVDDLVLNDWEVKDGDINIHHKSYGYLRTPEFSRVLAEFV